VLGTDIAAVFSAGRGRWSGSDDRSGRRVTPSDGMTPSGPDVPAVLLITPHIEPPVVELEKLLANGRSVAVHCTNPVVVQADRRALLDRLRYYWIDPVMAMIRLAPTLRRYELVISYYHRNGYWLGLLRRLLGSGRAARWVWIGFAPNPRRRGLAGWIKEALTDRALLGHDLVVCNALPVVEMIRSRYPRIAGRLAYVRWGGWGESADDGKTSAGAMDGGYVFCGGRTNRDFDTVLTAVARLGCPTVIVTGEDVQFSANVPGHVSVHRDISYEHFERLVEESRIVVVSLKRPDVSSGQVELGRAMRFGKPLVVTATAGLDDYVTDGKDAMLVAPGDAEDLGAKLASLLEDTERRKELGQAARLTYERSFNSRVFAHELFEVVTARSSRTHTSTSTAHQGEERGC
jgi:glycosyltransferase involved in cell wall biosynthesis